MATAQRRVRRGGPSLMVEVGSDWLKILQVQPAGRKVSISKIHLEKIDSAAEGLTDAIAAAVGRLKLAKIPATVCLPRQMVNVRMMDLPSTDPDEIADMVDLQSGKQTPYSKDEILFDYRIMGPGREGYTRVMLVIAQRSMIRQRFYALDEAGIEVDRMSVSSEGLLNWFRALGEGKGRKGTTLLLDIDSFYSDFAVLSDGRLLFTRSILVGANQLIGDHADWREKLVREVRRSMEMAKAELPELDAVRLVVSGAAPHIPGIDALLGKPLGLDVQVHDCLQQVSRLPPDSPLGDAPYRALSLTPLIGMGLAPNRLEFDLVPDSVRLKRALSEKARGLTALAMLVMALLVALSFVTSANLYIRKSFLRTLGEQIVRTEPIVQSVVRMQSIVKAARARQDPRLDAVNVLREIQRCVPQTVVLDNVDFDAEKSEVVLGGVAQGIQDIRSFVGRLEESELFATVGEAGPTQRERSGRFRFRLLCRLEAKQ